MASFDVLDSAAEHFSQPLFDQNRHCRELWGLNDQKAIMKQSAEQEEILLVCRDCKSHTSTVNALNCDHIRAAQEEIKKDLTRFKYSKRCRYVPK